MTLEEQHRWWLEEHAPIARQMPWLRGYVINLAARDVGPWCSGHIAAA
jgi:hypothetical protein